MWNPFSSVDAKKDVSTNDASTNTISGSVLNAQSQIVTLTLQKKAVPITSLTGNGVYDVRVEDVDDKEGGSSAFFLISKNSSKGGSIFRACATAGVHGEHVTLRWGANETSPCLAYSAYPQGDAPFSQRFKVTFNSTS